MSEEEEEEERGKKMVLRENHRFQVLMAKALLFVKDME